MGKFEITVTKRQQSDADATADAALTCGPDATADAALTCAPDGPGYAEGALSCVPTQALSCAPPQALSCVPTADSDPAGESPAIAREADLSPLDDS